MLNRIILLTIFCVFSFSRYLPAQEIVFVDATVNLPSPPISVAAGVYASVADFNGDGLDDVFLNAFGGQSWQLWINNSNAGFNVTVLTNPTLGAFGRPDVADVDGDGDLDIVQAFGAAGGLGRIRKNVILINQGVNSGVMIDESGIRFPGSNNNNRLSTFIKFLDYDGDGDNDLYIANLKRDQMWENTNGAGFFKDVTTNVLPGGSLVTDEFVVCPGDFDGDGDIDIFGVVFKRTNIFLRNQLSNTGIAIFTNDLTAIPPPPPGIKFEAQQAIGGDVDNDGDEDVIVMAIPRRDFLRNLLYINDGTGHFTEEGELRNLNPEGGFYNFSDINQDGSLDLIGIAPGIRGLNITGSILQNNGNGFFSDASALFEGGLPSAGEGEAFFSAFEIDANNDNKPDILITESVLGHHRLYLQPQPVNLRLVPSKRAINCYESDSVTVTVSASRDGAPVSGHVIDLQVISGDAEFIPTQVTTGPNGEATAKLIVTDGNRAQTISLLATSASAVSASVSVFSYSRTGVVLQNFTELLVSKPAPEYLKKVENADDIKPEEMNSDMSKDSYIVNKSGSPREDELRYEDFEETERFYDKEPSFFKDGEAVQRDTSPLLASSQFSLSAFSSSASFSSTKSLSGTGLSMNFAHTSPGSTIQPYTPGALGGCFTPVPEIPHSGQSIASKIVGGYTKALIDVAYAFGASVGGNAAFTVIAGGAAIGGAIGGKLGGEVGKIIGGVVGATIGFMLAPIVTLVSSIVSFFNPIEFHSGELILTVRDVEIQGDQFATVFERTFHGHNKSNIGIGVGWAHNWSDRLILLTNGDVSWSSAKAGLNIFTNVGGEFVSPSGLFLNLSEEDGIFSLADETGITTTFLSDGKMNTISNIQGFVTRLFYTNEKLAQVQGPGGRSIQFFYNSGNLLKGVIDPLGQTNLYNYDANINLVTVSLGSIYSSTYRYDTNHNMQFRNDPRVRDFNTDIFYMYDEFDRVITESNAEGNKINFSYQIVDGQIITSISNQNGNHIVVKTGVGGLVNSVNIADSGRISFQYNENQQIISVTNQIGSISILDYDEGGRLTSFTDPLGNRTAFAYTNFSRVKSITNSLGFVTDFSYDSRGRTVKTLLPEVNGSRPEINVFYGTNRQRTSIIDPLNNTTRFQYNAFGNLTNITLPPPNLLAVSPTLSLKYDLLGRPVRTTDALGNTRIYVWDSENNVNTITNEEGGTRFFRYDKFNNLTNYQNEIGNEWRYSYTPLNHLEKIVDPSGATETYQYDVIGNLTNHQDAEGFVTSFKYDLARNLTNQILPDGTSIHAKYDGVGRIVELRNDLGATELYVYNELQLAQINTPTGGRISYVYDKLGNALARTNTDGGV